MKKINLVFLMLIAFLINGCMINNVPKYDEEVKAKWAQLMNEYKRRADLIPNLVKTVKAYAKHEDKVFTEVTKLRSQVAHMKVDINNAKELQEYIAAQQKLSSALARLLAVSERYPDLKASKNFLMLQSQLEGTENRIAVARRDYIEAVKRYNLELRTIPNKWIAHLLYPDAKIKPTFTIDQKDMKVPEVNFN
ncbi:LemA family protein [Caminibacter pacificus]|jgi:LemA protein